MSDHLVPAAEPNNRPSDVVSLTFVLLLVLVIGAGVVLPGGGVAMACVGFATAVRRHRAMMIWLFAVGGFLFLSLVIGFVSHLVSVPVTTIH